MIYIAFITPWPDQHSGIAENSYNIVSSLKSHFKIDVITNLDNPRKIDGLDVLNHKNITDYSKYDNIVYEFGNNHIFHLFMIDILKKWGGILHLHDFVLHNLIASYCFSCGGGWQGYINIVQKWYGMKIAILVNKLKTAFDINFWETKDVYLLPLCEELIQYSDSCILNSEFSQKKVRRLFPNIPTKILSLYPSFDKSEFQNVSSGHGFKIGVFGNITRNRRLDIIINVVKFLSKNYDISLHIVGSIEEDQEYLMRDSRFCKNIIFYGRVEDSFFSQMFGSVDICINLRYPSMGETSSVALRALQKGIPLIVSDSGWYRELPGFVLKIPIDNIFSSLCTALITLLNRNRIKSIKAETDNFYKTHFTQDIVREKHIQVIESLHNTLLNRPMFKSLANVMDDLGIINDSNFFSPVINKIEDLF